MNGFEPFEQHLRRQPLREVPPAWRAEILRAARPAAAPRPASLVPLPAPWWRELLWPCPRAWAGLAAVWLVIIGLNGLTREPSSPALASQAAAASPQVRDLLQQQERLFAELVGPLEEPPATRPKPLAPPPHSARREEFFNA